MYVLYIIHDRLALDVGIFYKIHHSYVASTSVLLHQIQAVLYVLSLGTFSLI